METVETLHALNIVLTSVAALVFGFFLSDMMKWFYKKMTEKRTKHTKGDTNG